MAKPIIRIAKDNNHYLISLDGKVGEYRRVTHMIDSTIRNVGLEKWRQRVGEEEARRVSEETSEFGNQVHYVTELIDKGKSKMVDAYLRDHPDMIPYAIEWEAWKRDYVKKIVAIETVVWSRKWRVAGKIDRVLLMKGDRRYAIGDIKTGTLHDEIGIQIRGAYRSMYNALYSPKVDRTFAISMARKDFNGVKVKEYSGEEYQRKFEAILKLSE